MNPTPTNPPADDREALATTLALSRRLTPHPNEGDYLDADAVLSAGFRRSVPAVTGRGEPEPGGRGGNAWPPNPWKIKTPEPPQDDGDVEAVADLINQCHETQAHWTCEATARAALSLLRERGWTLNRWAKAGGTIGGTAGGSCGTGPYEGKGYQVWNDPGAVANPTEPPQDDVVAVARVLADVAQESYLLGANRVLAMLRERGWKPASEQTNEDWIYPDDVIAKAFEARTRLGLSFESPSLEHAAPHEISGVVRAALAATPPRGPRDESPLGAKLREHRRKIVESGTRLLTEEEVIAETKARERPVTCIETCDQGHRHARLVDDYQGCPVCLREQVNRERPVTEAMIEAACRSLYHRFDEVDALGKEYRMSGMRAAIAAALAVERGGA